MVTNCPEVAEREETESEVTLVTTLNYMDFESKFVHI